MAEEDLAAQNRRKLEEHLARLQQDGKVPPKGKQGAAQGAGAEQAPKPPPIPPGWEAWKKAHGQRIHSVRHVDAKEAADKADYKLLGLEPGASREEIRRAFGKLAKEYHPDVGGDAEIFQAMQAAYKRLTKA